MKSAILIALIAVFISAVTADAPWSNCGTGSDHAKISSLTFSPATPVIGQTFTLNVAGSLDENVTSGKVQISVTYAGSVPIIDQSVDLCSLDSKDLPCPLTGGAFSKSVSQVIPAMAPAGEFTGQISANDQNGQEIFCIKFDVTLAAASSVSEPMALDDEIISNVNKASKWVAGRNKRFEGVTLADAKKLMGTRLVKNPAYIPETTEASSNIPKEFDARTQWKDCIHPIRNQEQCGSCWAFSATEVLSDRFCIASKGDIDVILSPEDMVSCDQVDQGCNGGELNTAWSYLVQTGVVQDACFPYTAGNGNAPSCPESETCADGKPWTKYHAAAHTVRHPTSIEAIQTAIMTSGPVQAAFTVYQDFFSYKAGVYTHQSGSEAGGHAIKIVGWGVDNGQDYWIVANSWGPDWGLDGFFWIARGTDECGIEDNIYYGLPNLNIKH